jgi:hypothetical protein
MITMPVIRKLIGKTSVDPVTIRELVLFAENDSQLYRQSEAWSMNYARKKRNGSFNRSLALTGIANNFVPAILQKYKKEFGSLGMNFSAVDKRKIAVKLLPAILERADYELKAMKPLKKKVSK